MYRWAFLHCPLLNWYETSPPNPCLNISQTYLNSLYFSHRWAATEPGLFGFFAGCRITQSPNNLQILERLHALYCIHGFAGSLCVLIFCRLADVFWVFTLCRFTGFNLCWTRSCRLNPFTRTCSKPRSFGISVIFLVSIVSHDGQTSFAFVHCRPNIQAGITFPLILSNVSCGRHVPSKLWSSEVATSSSWHTTQIEWPHVSCDRMWNHPFPLPVYSSNTCPHTPHVSSSSFISLAKSLINLIRAALWSLSSYAATNVWPVATSKISHVTPPSTHVPALLTMRQTLASLSVSQWLCPKSKRATSSRHFFSLLLLLCFLNGFTPDMTWKEN